MDTVARLGGDEFVVVLGELGADRALSAEHARETAEKVRASLARPYRLEATQASAAKATIEHHCFASIDVALMKSAMVAANSGPLSSCRKWPAPRVNAWGWPCAPGTSCCQTL